VAKEPYYKAKETYSYGKRGLFTLAERNDKLCRDRFGPGAEVRKS